ncbi:radical SAM protein [Trichloromonas sp.]|uniref:radical SAM protein n=1 Tax=Trichloromonas sp. TaxID=3069249 RepID=UPI003D81871F
MFVSNNDLLWMLRQVDGQRVNREKLIRKFMNHGIYSLLPYFGDIELFFDSSDEKHEIINKFIRALELSLNQEIGFPDDNLNNINYRSLKKYLLPVLVQAIKGECFSALIKGTRVRVRPDSGVSNVKPGSEGFITEKLNGLSTVRFYSIAGRYGVDTFIVDIPDEELQVLTVDSLLERHHDFNGVAQYFYNDSLLRAMKSSMDSSVYSFAANLAIKFLADEGYIKVEGDDFISVPGKIFSVIAPKLDETYKNAGLFSSHSLSSPPSERKPHVLRLELTTGCDYNRCTFCSEYSGMNPSTKSFHEFKEHVDRVVVSIGNEKSRIQRLFIGSGNSLGVETELLLESLNYAAGIFNPQRISLYGRTASILEKSVDELKRLKAAGFTMLYWGLESGSDEVLSYACKDCTRDDMIEASKMLAEAEIEVSAMLIPGLGGLRLAEEHLAGTLELLHNIDIAYLTLLSINPCESSVYAKKMKSETNNRHLTPDEVNTQVYRLLEGLNTSGLRVGMFTEEVDQVSRNTMRFNFEISDSNKELLLRDLLV